MAVVSAVCPAPLALDRHLSEAFWPVQHIESVISEKRHSDRLFMQAEKRNGNGKGAWRCGVHDTACWLPAVVFAVCSNAAKET